MASSRHEYRFDFNVFGPTANRFNWCSAESGVVEKCAMGERGTGKTDAGIGSMTHHALRQPPETRPIPWAIVRDTWKNLERTVLDSFLNPRPGSFPAQIRPHLKFRDAGRYLELPGVWVAHLFGVDSLGDLEKLRMQLGGLWVEEPAPAAVADIGAGIDEYVVTLGKSSLRYPCQWQVCQVTMNYPDEDHWTWRRYGQGYRPGIHLFKIGKGENPAITDDYYRQMEADFKDDPAMLDRLVYGKPAFVVQGERVTPEYDPVIHRAAVQLQPQPNVPGIRFWDGYLHPACVVAQLTPRGYLHVYETFQGDNIGVRQLIGDEVAPAMKEHYSMIREWTDIGDPSMATADQSDSGQSAAQVVSEMLKTQFIQGPSDWRLRLEAVKFSLLKKIDDRPFLVVCPTEKYLHRALRGGWHYRKDPSGRILSEKPVKNINSHAGDAYSHGIPRILRFAKYASQNHGQPRVIHDWNVYGGAR